MGGNCIATTNLGDYYGSIQKDIRVLGQLLSINLAKQPPHSKIITLDNLTYLCGIIKIGWIASLSCMTAAFKM